MNRLWPLAFVAFLIVGAERGSPTSRDKPERRSLGSRREHPPARQRRRLARLLKREPAAIRFSEHLDAQNGEAMFRHACTMGLEGIVSKRLTSRYTSGRCRSWLKVKNPGYERRGGGG
jgi:ATP dependent DNA ligase domain